MKTRNLFTTVLMIMLAATNLTACGKAKEQNSMKQETGKKVLVAYFSRTGENYSVGNITKGNTHIVAEEIANMTGGELFEIKPAKAYPNNYDRCTEVAQKEANDDARPAIANDKSVDDYDIVFIGYPIWWGNAPMCVYTWIDKQEWNGKTVIPFCTHEGSGLGASGRLIGDACKGAEALNGFELYGHTAQKNPKETHDKVEKWIKKLNLQ